MIDCPSDDGPSNTKFNWNPSNSFGDGACEQPDKGNDVYRVIQKDGLNWTVNGASTHARQLVAVFQVLCSLYGLTCVGYAQNSLEFVSCSPLIHVVGRSFAFTQTAYLLKLVIPTTNALPRWRLNVETKTKRTLHSSRQLSFNELTNTKIMCCIVAILLSTDAAAWLCARLAL